MMERDVRGSNETQEAAERAPYEAPTLIDFGAVEELTRGAMHINLDDFPVGAKVINPSAPMNQPQR